MKTPAEQVAVVRVPNVSSPVDDIRHPALSLLPSSPRMGRTTNPSKGNDMDNLVVTELVSSCLQNKSVSVSYVSNAAVLSSPKFHDADSDLGLSPLTCASSSMCAPEVMAMEILKSYFAEETKGYDLFSRLLPHLKELGWTEAEDMLHGLVFLAPWVAMLSEDGGAILKPGKCCVSGSLFVLNKDFFRQHKDVIDYLAVNGCSRNAPLLESIGRVQVGAGLQAEQVHIAVLPVERILLTARNKGKS